MRPANRNFHRSQSMVAREIEQLWIKSKPLNPLLVEDNFAPLAPERFEATLRVHEPQPQHDPDNLVEHNAGKLPKSRLVHSDQVSVQRARADGQIVMVQRGD